MTSRPTRTSHGGYEQAVYAYAREDLDWWVEQLGRELRDGLFGENITTAGLDVSGAAIGETWRLGTAVVQVTSPRIPCVTFASWLGEDHWVKRFAQAGRPGAYLRVLSEGEVGPGDDIEVLERPAVEVTVAESMRAYYGDTGLMRRLLQVDGLNSRWDRGRRACAGPRRGLTRGPGRADGGGATSGRRAGPGRRRAARTARRRRGAGAGRRRSASTCTCRSA